MVFGNCLAETQRHYLPEAWFIWERITPTEVYKLYDKLQEVIQYGNYHKKIEGLSTVEDCKNLEFELMENDNMYLNRVLGKLWTELEAKEEEIGKAERLSVRKKSNRRRMRQKRKQIRRRTRLKL